MTEPDDPLVPTQPAPESGETTAPPQFELRILGRLLGKRYKIVEQLGRGGMGSIYLAHDRNLEGKSVVVKVPHPALLVDPGFKARFQEEVRSLARLEHPHIVKVLDSGALGETPYVILQHLGGGSLATRLEDAEGGRLELGDVQEMLLHVARALDFVHARGVIHRDVKPDNILMDEHGAVYLADFGIAKALSAQHSKLTMTGFTPGSPAYMAPEQAMGQSLTPAADQYALAVTIFNALTGRLPFKGDTPMAVLIQKEKGTLVPLAEVRPDLPESAGRALDRALSREPDKRFPSCEAFVAALGGTQTVPTTAPTTVPVVPPVRPSRKRLVLGASAALVALGVLVWAIFGGRSGGGPVSGGSTEPDPASLREHVEHLAHPGLNGRAAWEDRVEVARYVAGVFANLGLQAPPGHDEMTFDAGGTGDTPRARNVAAWLTGVGAAAEAGEYVLIGSHYDGNGRKEGTLYPSADNNASGVAAVLETARTLAEIYEQKPKPRRSICFVAFDLGKSKDQGSARFAENAPVDLDACVAAVSVEQVGRSLSDYMPGTLFVLGAENSVRIEAIADDLAPSKGAQIAILGMDFFIGAPDCAPFRAPPWHIPSVFVTAGPSPEYGRPKDTPDKLDYDGLANHTRWLRDLVLEIAELPDRPVWRNDRPPRLQELRAVRRVIAAGEEELRDSTKVPELARTALKNFARYVDERIERGDVTDVERAEIVKRAHMLWLAARLWVGNEERIDQVPR